MEAPELVDVDSDGLDEPAAATPAFPTDDEIGPTLDELPAGARPRWKIPRLGFRVRVGRPDPAARGLVYGILSAGLQSFGAIIHQRAASDLVYGPNPAWLLDEQDVETIGGALANMAARRVPTGLGPEGDAADLLSLAIGLGGYTMKGLSNQAELARRKGMTAAGPLEYSDPTGAPPEPAEPVVDVDAARVYVGLS